MTTIFSTSTIVPGPGSGTSINSVQQFNPGVDAGELDPFPVWPLPGERHHVHPWHDAKETARRFCDRQERYLSELFPRSRAFGDDVDDPGKLSKFHQHRIAETAVANAIWRSAIPRARELERYDDADRLSKRALAMFSCRHRGPVGYNADGKLIVQWEEKCGLAKYCPDEAVKESKRLGDSYLEPTIEHRRKGGRVYKGVLTLPNYPGGRLKEGVRHAFARWKSKLWRAINNGENKFGIEGALVILEAPLGKDGDWNIHLNVILLTRGFLSYKNVYDSWGGFNLHLKRHLQFDDEGMSGLFNEVVKYGTRAMPEKSSDGQHTAPAMIEWEPWELIEWHLANKGFRRTRSYGCLFKIGKPDNDFEMPTHWLGRIEYRSNHYVFIRRQHNLALYRDMLLDGDARALNLVRGDKSTTKRRGNTPRGPP